MRQPLWILNSALFLLIILISIFVLFSRVAIEERESIKPEGLAVPVSKGVSKVVLEKIYKYDIFKTYRKEIPEPKEPEYVVALPEPPKPEEPITPSDITVKFMDPLNITLKGIMILIDGSEGSAIIADNKTNQEFAYRIGDKIEDAQLIRIFNNKVIFVRSNGQQEVFYLREKDAQADPTFLITDDWKDVVKKIKANNYLVSPAMFVNRIKNLAQFIDMLGLTSAYKSGKSVGCRIGQMSPNSLGIMLGLNPGDIIKSVIDIPAINTKNRLRIYNTVTSLQEGDSIEVKLLRGLDTYILNYKLQELRPLEKKETIINVKQIKEEQKKMLEKKYKFAPTIRELRKREKHTMFYKGGRPVQNPKIAE